MSYALKTLLLGPTCRLGFACPAIFRLSKLQISSSHQLAQSWGWVFSKLRTQILSNSSGGDRLITVSVANMRVVQVPVLSDNYAYL